MVVFYNCVIINDNYLYVIDLVEQHQKLIKINNFSSSTEIVDIKY